MDNKLLGYHLVLIAQILLLFGCRQPEIDQPETADVETEMPIIFTDVTIASGLGEFRHQTGAFGQKWFPETMGAGGGFLDYNQDGILDIILVSGSEFPSVALADQPALQLFQGTEEGRFYEVTTEVGLESIGSYAFGLSVSDYDNDGDPDIFVTALYENLLLQNDQGIFREVAQEAGLGRYSEWSTVSVFFDANRDGWLDLYVGNYVHWTPEEDIFCTRVGDTKSYCTPEQYQGITSRFYVNQRDGTFEEQSDDFMDLPGKTLGATSIDFNKDQWPDLIVANDTQRDLLFENLGNGRFTEKGVASGIAFDENGRARAGMGLDIGVVDETGEETVFIGHFSGEMVGVYRHAGNGIFTERAAVSQIGRPSLPTLTFGIVLADFDLDGDLDLVTANGHITEDIGEVEEGITFKQQAQLYTNTGAGRFAIIEPSGVFADSMVARGASWADYDRDGDPDLLITENGGPVHLWRNDTESGNSLTVTLRGTQSNRDAIGSRVRVKANHQWQERYLRLGTSYLSQSQLSPMFGIGNAESIDSLEVLWPSGEKEVFTDIPSGTIIFNEGESQ
ncbi:MAG: CRTAC1 family protein [Bacteroidetes bacterium]|nr:CRTAC1 family protein [Bacteroidota bacterium]